jgi:hypothetical protein
MVRQGKSRGLEKQEEKRREEERRGEGGGREGITRRIFLGQKV